MGIMSEETRNKRRGSMLFLHGVWVEPALYEYIKAKGPKRGSEWMRGALALVMAAEVRREETRANDARHGYDEEGNDAGGGQ
jgi:hypothetical protein